MTRREWYDRRDNRTLLITPEGTFKNAIVGIIIGEEVKKSFGIQITTLLSLNIMARWCRHIRLFLPEVKSLLNESYGQSFRRVIRETVTAADPYCNLEFLDAPDEVIGPVLLIGSFGITRSDPFYWIGASGWRYGSGWTSTAPKRPPRFRDNNKLVVGPAMVAAIGASEMFKVALGDKTKKQHGILWTSLFDFSESRNFEDLLDPSVIENFDFGKIVQVGCGAVGASLDYLLRLTKWEGSLNLVDHDYIEYTDCNRALSLNKLDADIGTPKVDACKQLFKNTGILAQSYAMKYSKFVSAGKLSSIRPDLLLCLANEDVVWATIQENYPPIVLHATTSENWGINYGRHIPMKEWCLLCRFQIEIDKMHTFVPECGQGLEPTVEVGERKLGVLPFLSPSAAVLILAGMARIACSDSPLLVGNFVDFSMKPSGCGSFMVSHRRAKQDCVCSGQSEIIYRELLGNYRFSELKVDC